MKMSYVCEKCGERFWSYEEAIKCEESHILVETVNRYDLASSDRYDSGDPYKLCLGEELQDFRYGEALPVRILVKYPKRNPDGSVMHDEHGNLVYGIAGYCLDTTNDPSNIEIEERVSLSISADLKETSDRLKELEKARSETADETEAK